MLKVNIKKLTINRKEKLTELFTNLNFHLLKGKIYTVLGTNGTGKSTLIKSITKLLDPKIYSLDGEVIYNGINLLDLPDAELNKIRQTEIKYVFQDAINSFDHLKKIGYYFNCFLPDNKDVDKMFDYFLLPPKQKLFGLYPYEVSGGMAQRISFAFAVLSNPNLLILDEPTSGIDSAIANLIILGLKDFSIRENSTVLLVTQDLDLTEKVSDFVAFLSKGALSEFKSKNDFFNDKNSDPELTNFLNANNFFKDEYTPNT